MNNLQGYNTMAGSENPMKYYDAATQTHGQPQLIPFFWQRKALIDLKKEQYFGQLADTTTMP